MSAELSCRATCPFFARYGSRNCADAAFIGLHPCEDQVLKILEDIKEGGRFKSRSAGGLFYRRDSNESKSDRWCDYDRVGTLEDGVYTPVA